MIKKIVLVKFLILVVLTIITIITLKNNLGLKDLFYEKVFETNISFASINKWYENKFGSILPFSDYLEIEPVFNEDISYSNLKSYNDGYELEVGFNYLVPSINDGIVTFIGDKEGYGNTVIIEHADGVVIWYSNLDVINVKIYDYIKKGNLVGEASEKLYLVFYKNGELINYEEFI